MGHKAWAHPCLQVEPQCALAMDVLADARVVTVLFEAFRKFYGLITGLMRLSCCMGSLVVLRGFTDLGLGFSG